MRWLHRTLAVALLAVALLAATAVTPPSSVAAPSPGSGGWYWPTGTENFGGFYYFMQFRGSNWHLAQDMKASKGTPVYAIGDGVVLEAKQVAGYGPGNGYGGAMVILHRTASGTEFKALYGHVDQMRYRKGDVVAAGAVIAVINGYNPGHLHFGIHPGRAYPPGNNPFRGHTHVKSNRYGYVDPVSYLRTHPRKVSYKAPPLPVVASFATTTTPQWAHAALGWAYWEAGSPDSTQTTTYAYRFSTNEQRTLGETETVPPADAVRYKVSSASAPEPTLSVYDRRPRLTLSTSPAAPIWGARVSASGTVTNALGQPFEGARVVVERRYGTGWRTLGTTYTDVSGRYVVQYAQTGAWEVRARFSPPAPFVSCCSASRKSTPKAALSPPAARSSRPHRFSFSGTLKPRHSSGAQVGLQYQRKIGGAWVSQRIMPTRVTDLGSANRYGLTLVFRSHGSYRIRAIHRADSQHTDGYSAWRYFTVR